MRTPNPKTRRTVNAVLSAVLALQTAVGALVPTTPAQAIIANGMPAIDEAGQYDRIVLTSVPGTVQFTGKGANGGATRIGFNQQQSIVMDPVRHRFFAADANNRVLVFNLNTDNTFPDKVADYVLGQSDFIDTAARTTQSGLASPGGLALDLTNQLLFVSDFATTNSRVMVFDLSGAISTGMTAPSVLGQPNFTTGNLATTQAGLRQPFYLDFDAVHRRLFVADFNNNRTLVYDLSGGISNGMNAAYVLGQPDFISSGVATTQSGTRTPGGIAYDATHDRLFVSEFNGSRILVYDVRTAGSSSASLCGTSTTGIANGMNASCVLGQTLFTTTTAATTQSGLRFAVGLSYDAIHDRLYVADRSNARVVRFDLSRGISNGMNADKVLGQSLFTTNTTAVSQTGFNTDQGVFYDGGSERLFVRDTTNSRVMVFDVAAITDGEAAVADIGPFARDSQNPLTLNYARGGINNGPTDFGFSRPTGEALDSVNHSLFVTDTLNNRVVVFSLNADNTLPDKTADYVLGQADFTGKDSATTQSRMAFPEGLAFDPSGNRLFVADGFNNRVLVYDTASLSNGMNASFV